MYVSLADIEATLATFEAAFAALFAEEATAEGRETVIAHKSARGHYVITMLLHLLHTVILLSSPGGEYSVGRCDVPSSQTAPIFFLLHNNLLGRSLLVLHRRALLVVALLLWRWVALLWVALGRVALRWAIAVKKLSAAGGQERGLANVVMGLPVWQ